MGLGKTIQVLALHLVSPMKEPTLVVAPASILDNWAAEVKRFLGFEEKDLFIYRGENVNRVEPGTFKSRRIVLTSYNHLSKEETSLVNTIANFRALRKDPAATHRANLKNTENKTFPDVPISSKRSQTSLFAILWGRVILDEGHAIRNKKTITFRAAFRLRSRKRIVVTGTPFANEYTDVQSLFAFLRIPPFSLTSFFRPYFLNKHRNKNDRSVIEVLPNTRNAVLHLALQGIMIRRMKTDGFEGKLVVNIPKPIYITIPLRLDNGVRVAWTSIWKMNEVGTA